VQIWIKYGKRLREAMRWCGRAGRALISRAQPVLRILQVVHALYWVMDLLVNHRF
jgi:hypothetical protein